ncbi:hypothetical protein DFH08DRAFT_800152 [Mycena albidolilacea]|uniref:Uncharacterized protein n=1 Tax=Mycena albidolilacea TaxID=1033008 RepID=A0AAD7AJ72_9AGAR|nr:hypothetical protein DFH08DRAFT_800152 [Mycena albidolilacea]
MVAVKINAGLQGAIRTEALQYDEDGMDSSGAVQIAQNTGSTMQTTKAEPLLEGRGWIVQKKVVRLEQQPYTLPDFEKIESFPVQASVCSSQGGMPSERAETDPLEWMESIIQAEEVVAG